MNIRQNLQEVRAGFHPTFWVANIMELFERLAYYGQQIVFMIYLRNKLGFTEAEAGQLSGVFGGIIYLLPILAGTLADRWGFRRAFNVAFSILALGYFLIGSVGMHTFSDTYNVHRIITVRQDTLTPGAADTIMISARVGGRVTPLQLSSNRATAWPEGTAPFNQMDSSKSFAQNLQIATTMIKGSITEGDTIVYRTVVRNVGTAVACGIVVIDTIRSPLAVIGYSSSGGRLEVGQISVYWLFLAFLIFTALGGSFIKPSVLGTVAVTSTEKSKSLGYAIYYWLVNIGAAIGPTIAYFVRDSLGNQYVYMVSATSCLAMLVVNMMLYKEVKAAGSEVVESLGKKIRNLFVVLANFKFMIFLLIYSLYWIIFWQEFIIVPYYVTDYISANYPYEILQSWAAAGAIILFQIPVNRLTKNIPTRTAIAIGFAVSSLIWVIIGIYPSILTIAAGIVAFALGEMTQAPRYYQYISEIAPPGQQGLYQGYAFLPIAIARFVGDPFGGWLYGVSKAAGRPEYVWWALIGVGVLGAVAMLVYNYFTARQETRTA